MSNTSSLSPNPRSVQHLGGCPPDAGRVDAPRWGDWPAVSDAEFRADPVLSRLADTRPIKPIEEWLDIEIEVAALEHEANSAEYHEGNLKRARSLRRAATRCVERWHRQQRQQATPPRRTSYRASRVARVQARRAAKSGDSNDGEPDAGALAILAAAERLGVEIHGRSFYEILEGVILALEARCVLCGADGQRGLGIWTPPDRPPLVYVWCPRHTPADAERHFGWHGVPDGALS